MPEGSTLPPERTSALDAIDKIFHARSIAVVGATERAGYGARFLNTLIRTGFPGQLYPINPSRPEVFGLRCYPSPRDLPEAPDLAGMIVPAERVLESLRQCAEIGVRAAIVISAGFAELNTAEGRQRQADLRRLVAETGLRRGRAELPGREQHGRQRLGDGIVAGRCRPPYRRGPARR